MRPPERLYSRGLALLAAALFVACKGPPEYEKHLRAGDAILETNPAEAKRHFERAVELGATAQGNAGWGRACEELRQWNEAAQHFEQAREAVPDNPSIRLALGRVYLILGRNGDARTELAWVADKHPEEIGGLLLLSSISNSKESARQNLERLDRWQAMTKDAPTFEVEVVRAELYRMLGDAAAGEAANRRADSAQLWQAGAAAELGFVFKLRGKLDAARHMLRAATKQNEADPEPWLDLLDVELTRRDAAGAAHAAKGIPPLHRESQRALELLGRFELSRGQPDKASELLRKALGKTPPSDAESRARLLLSRAQALTASNDAAGALDQLEELLRIDANHLRGRLARDGLWLKQGRRDEAVRDLQALLDRHPRDGRVFELLISSLLAAKDHHKAETVAKRYAKTHPNQAAPEIMLGIVYRTRGDHPQAVTHFEKALQCAPDSTRAFKALLAVEFEDGGYETAVAAVSPLAKQATSWQLPVLLGDFHASHGRPDLANAAYQQATKIAPDAPVAWSKVAHHLLAQGDGEGAIKAFERATELRPTTADLKQLARLQLERANHQGAHRAYVQLLRLNPRSVEALNNLAMLYGGPLKSPERALQHARRAYEIMPESMAVNDTYGWLLVQHGGYKERKLAITLLARAAQKLDSPEIVYHLAKAQVATGDREAARKSLQQALAKSDDFQGALEAKALLKQLGSE